MGTIGCKCALYDPKGVCISQYNKEYPLIYTGSFVEQDAHLWWTLVCEGIKSVTEQAGVHEITALSISTQGISFVPVDACGNTLGHAISWLDERSVDEARELEECFGRKKIYQITGKPTHPCYTFPKLVWLKKHRKALFNRTCKFLLPLDFLNYRLTGRAVTDYTMAGGTMLYDIAGKRWSPELLDYIELSPVKLPEVACMGSKVGNILPDIAKSLGINAASVILGGQDQKLAAIGAGIAEGVCTVSFGTSTAVSVLENDFCQTSKLPQFRLNDTHFISEGVVPTSGAALKWLASVAFGGKSYNEMNDLAKTSCKGAKGVKIFPDFTGNARIEGLTLSTTQGDMVYALYEGVCRGIRDCLNSQTVKLVVFGGGSKSDIWCSILADITGCTVCACDSPETASRGAARLASGMEIPCESFGRVFSV